MIRKILICMSLQYFNLEAGQIFLQIMQIRQIDQSQSFNPQFVFLTKQQAYQSSTLIFQANKDTFPHLIHGRTSEQQFKQQNIELIDKCFQTQEKYNQNTKKNTHFCYGLKMDGKIVAIMLAIELKEYYSSIQHEIQVVQFYNQFKYLKIEELTQGTAVYYTRLSVRPQLKGKGLGKRLFYQASKYLKSEGYSFAIMGSIAKPSFQMFKKLGCIIQRHEQAVRTNFTYQIYIFKAPFQAIMHKLQTEYALKSAKP